MTVEPPTGPGSPVGAPTDRGKRAKNDPLDDRQVGWHADPFGRHGSRWWDGTTWSERVRTGTTQGIDPPGIEHAPTAARINEPAAPIDDAVLPLARPSIADKLAVALACVVFLALVALLVVAITTT